MGFVEKKRKLMKSFSLEVDRFFSQYFIYLYFFCFYFQITSMRSLKKFFFSKEGSIFCNFSFTQAENDCIKFMAIRINGATSFHVFHSLLPSFHRMNDKSNLLTSVRKIRKLSNIYRFSIF